MEDFTESFEGEEKCNPINDALEMHTEQRLIMTGFTWGHANSYSSGYRCSGIPGVAEALGRAMRIRQAVHAHAHTCAHTHTHILV